MARPFSREAHLATTSRHNGASKTRRPPTINASMRTVRNDMSKLVEDVGTLAQAAGAKTRSQVAGLAERAQERGRGALETLEERVRESPAIALGAAVGVGVITGLLLARRH
jgi:ElaB/YqjD/DUF883 family membrane-anchored ribosome-binding protein